MVRASRWTAAPRRRVCTVAIVAGVALGGRANAGDRGPHPPVQLELDPCLDGDRDALLRAAAIELGDDAPATEGTPPVVVHVACAGGADDGIVLEVRRPDNPHHYRYALRWRTQPPDVRPRLLGLAVAEAVNASRIELTAVPDAPSPVAAAPSATSPPPPRTASAWSLSVSGGRRWYTTVAGLAMYGVGVMPARRLSPRVRLAADLIAEDAAVVAPSGAVQVLSLSSAPRVLIRLGHRFHGDLGVGLRVGVVRMTGEPPPGGVVVGTRLTRAWFGPAALAAAGVDLTPGMAIDVGLELGVVGSGVTAHDLGQPVAAIGGRWLSLGLAATMAL